MTTNTVLTVTTETFTDEYIAAHREEYEIVFDFIGNWLLRHNPSSSALILADIADAAEYAELLCPKHNYLDALFNN